ncbi:sulfotransferase family protein [Aphanothece sacrum]|uniref:Sulfotransferase n=1 Tax=Aphanothece sacrum FPU1 TaxID=1920663 RepID=A0A401III4_APHSA|nr:sulfotransferase [Aphanothece sacrum]GBF80990.1 sulfotransferase [Aphanothece sacrum FPU1]GBF85297.1 sulfotransferase [Aphanothece sacrum FPU3]
MKLVNFIVIGAVKSGTSSVYSYLKEHPQVYMSSIKEPKFFQWDGENRRFSTKLDDKIYQNAIKTFDEYKALFSEVKDETAIGEASVSYLYNKEAPGRMHRRFPDLKLIAILRHPADRAFSHYLHTKWLGHEPLSFSEALAQENQRIEANWGPSWHYRKQGFYYEQINRYKSLFDESQFKIYLYDDLGKDSLNVMQNMYQYLGIDTTFIPDISKQYNVRSFPKNQILDQIINKPNVFKDKLKNLLPNDWRKNWVTSMKRKNSWKPKLDPQLRQELTEGYKEDIIKLQDLIDKDLSLWIS